MVLDGELVRVEMRAMTEQEVDMAGTPPASEKGLLEIMVQSLQNAVRAWLHQRRRPRFGDVSAPQDLSPSSTADDAQMMFDLAGNTVTPPPTSPTAQPAPTPVSPTRKATFPTVKLPPQLTSLRLPTDVLSSWSHTVTLDIWTWLFWLAALLTLVLRFYRFDSLQSEMYGDIEIVQTYTKSVLRGEWPWYFSLSSGPLYHYMIAPLINAIGTGYDQIKIASILTSLAIVAFVTGSVRQLFGRQMGIIALAVAGSGSWLLVFSRLGNSQIFVPLVTIASLYALLRFINGNRQGWLYAAALIATCGLYSYPQSFVVPPVMWLTVVVLWRTGVIPTRRDVIVFTVATLIGSLPFIWMYINDPASITGNYISEKFETTDLAPSRFIEILLRAAAAYFVIGDSVFRSNPKNLAHIDIVSSVLFVVGILACFKPEFRRKAPVLLVPFALLHLPSMLVLRYPEQVPSASRSIGVAPYAYIFVAMGLYEIYTRLKHRWASIAGIVATLIFVLSLQQNIDRYFVRYVAGMPYNDVPIGREIVKYANSLSPDTSIYVVGCCWRDGTPGPFFSQIQMNYPTMLKRFDPADTLTCDALAQTDRPAVIIWGFDSEIPSPNVESCKEQFLPVLHTMPNGVPLFYSAALKGTAKPMAVPVPALPPNSLIIDPNAIRLPSLPDLPNLQQEQAPGQTAEGQKTSLAVQIRGVDATVTVSEFDMGSIPDLFDESYDSLIRSTGSNAFQVDVVFAQPVDAKTIATKLSGMRSFIADLTVTTAEGDQSFTQEFADTGADAEVTFDLPASLSITAMKLVIAEQGVPEDVDTHIHMRQLIIE